jgi:hypothetical protein
VAKPPLVVGARSRHHAGVKKALVFVVVLVGLGALARRVASEMENIDWEQRLERMPDNAPPKWMFRNISAIRENTERILEALERQRPAE